MIYIENNGFRVASISRICGAESEKPEFRTLDIKEGLAVEKVNEDGRAFVLGFVKPDEDEETKVDMIGTRFFDYVEPQNYRIARTMFQVAIKMVSAANYKEEDL